MSTVDISASLENLVTTGDAYARRRDPRTLLAATFGVAFALGGAAAAAYATVDDRWGLGAIVLVAAAVSASMSALLVPWRRLDQRWQLMLCGLAVCVVDVGVYVFDLPALGLLTLMPMMALTYFFGRERRIVVAGLTFAIAAYALPVVTGTTEDAATAMIVTLPAMVAVAVLSGALAGRFHAMRARERGRYKATIEALATALTARDGYTGTHSQETLWFVQAVCDELGLEPHVCEFVSDVALLHDIGKLGIPNEVLHAPGRLTDEQWEIMKTHPEIGERIVATVPGLEEVARAIRHEHEHWDGSGYPDGLKQGEIPLASRIVLACDAFHAMTSDRPYRAAMSEARARAELARNAGTQFDPIVVGALLRVLDSRVVGPLPAPAASSDTSLLVAHRAVGVQA